MKLTFLGTGTSMGVPVIHCTCEVCKSDDSRDKRLRTSVLIQSVTTHVVIDTGPDFRQQMLLYGPPSIDGIIFTHEHRDHIAGLDDIRPYNYYQNKPIDVYATQRVHQQLQREFDYIFAQHKYPGIPEVKLNEIYDKTFQIGDIPFVPVKVMHHKMPVLGFRVQNLAYITDANYIDEHEMQKLQNLDVLILNALQHDPHISHFTLKQAIDIVIELKPKQAYFTHISHKLGKYSEIERILYPNIKLAYDGLTIHF